MAFNKRVAGSGEEENITLAPPNSKKGRLEADSEKGKLQGREVSIPSLSSVPTDILGLIFGYTPVSGFFGLRLICKRWYQIVHKGAQWASLRANFPKTKNLFADSAIGYVAPQLARGAKALQACQKGALTPSFQAHGLLDPQQCDERTSTDHQVLCCNGTELSLIDFATKQTISLSLSDFLTQANEGEKDLVKNYMNQHCAALKKKTRLYYRSDRSMPTTLSFVGGRYLVLHRSDQSVIALQKDLKPVIFFKKEDEREDLEGVFECRVLDAERLYIQTRQCVGRVNSMTYKWKVSFYVLDLSMNTPILLGSHEFPLHRNEDWSEFTMKTRDGMAAFQFVPDRVSVFYLNHLYHFVKQADDTSFELFDLTQGSIFVLRHSTQGTVSQCFLSRFHLNTAAEWVFEDLTLDERLKQVMTEHQGLPLAEHGQFSLLNSQFIMSFYPNLSNNMPHIVESAGVWTLSGHLNLPIYGETPFVRRGILLGDVFIFARDRTLYAKRLARPPQINPLIVGQVPDPILSFFLYKDELIVQTTTGVYVLPIIPPDPSPQAQVIEPPKT